MGIHLNDRMILTAIHPKYIVTRNPAHRRISRSIIRHIDISPVRTRDNTILPTINLLTSSHEARYPNLDHIAVISNIHCYLSLIGTIEELHLIGVSHKPAYRANDLMRIASSQYRSSHNIGSTHTANETGITPCRSRYRTYLQIQIPIIKRIHFKHFYPTGLI